MWTPAADPTGIILGSTDGTLPFVSPGQHRHTAVILTHDHAFHAMQAYACETGQEPAYTVLLTHGGS